MTDAKKSLRGLRLGANPYSVHIFDRLSPSEQAILTSKKPIRKVMASCVRRPSAQHEVLLEGHRAPASDAPNARRVAVVRSHALGDRCDLVIGNMVLDGILEVEVNGRMLSGPAAAELFFGEGGDAPEPSETLSALSRRALEYAEVLNVVDTATLSVRLYAYNRVPASARWRRLLSDESAVERQLGIGEAALVRLLSGRWIQVGRGNGGGWMAWQARARIRAGDATPAYKLYVSPACAQLREAFAAVAAAVSRSASFQWKVGSDVYGLLRPDKIVVYFTDFADLQETAADLLAKLDGCPAQGVPFTAAIESGRLLSWGIDPPGDEHTVPWLKRESWRARICNRLAGALVVAKTSVRSGMSPSRFAMERMRLDGIDPNTWTATSR